MIVGIGWRVVVTNISPNCMHIQAVVHIMHAIAKTCSVAIVMDYYITIGWNAIAKATAHF